MEKFKTTFEPRIEAWKPTTAEESNGVDGNCEKVTEGELIKNFGSYTTLHGFHFIFDSGTAHRRVFWLCLMIFGFTSLFIQVFYNISRLKSNETSIRKSVEISENLQFPAITICNQNMLKRSKITGTQAQDYLDQLDELKIHLGGLEIKNVPSFDMEKAVRESGHSIQDMISDCNFKGIKCSGKNFTPAMMSFTVSVFFIKVIIFLPTSLFIKYF
jgi:hypothetical protein